MVKLLLSIVAIVSTYVSAIVVSDVISLNYQRFALDVIKLIALKVFALSMAYNFEWAETKLVKDINVYIKTKLITSMYRTSVENLSKEGTLYNILYEDSILISAYVLAVNDFLIQMLVIVIVFSLIIRLDVRIAAFLMTFMPVIIYINVHYGKMIREEKKEENQRNDFFSSFLKSLICNLIDVNINDGNHIFERKASFFMNEIKEQNLSVDKKSIVISYITRCWRDVINLSVIILGGIDVLKKTIKIEDYIALSSYAALVTNNIERFSSLATMSHKYAPCIERVNSLISLAEEDKDSCLTLLEGQSLRIDNIDIGVSNVILKSELNYRFIRNNIYYIFGKNGTGKTTLLNTICGIYALKRGEIYDGDKRIDGFPYYYLRKSVCYVFQQPSIFYGLSIKDNILMGNNDKEADMHYMCNYMGIEKEIMSFENGFETIVNDDCRLSAGQRKKIQLIRGLLRDVPIYLFDEPTENLDSTSKNSFFKILGEIKNNSIVLVVTHDDIQCQNAIYLDDDLKRVEQ